MSESYILRAHIFTSENTHTYTHVQTHTHMYIVTTFQHGIAILVKR